MILYSKNDQNPEITHLAQHMLIIDLAPPGGTERCRHTCQQDAAPRAPSGIGDEAATTQQQMELPNMDPTWTEVVDHGPTRDQTVELVASDQSWPPAISRSQPQPMLSTGCVSFSASTCTTSCFWMVILLFPPYDHWPCEFKGLVCGGVSFSHIRETYSVAGHKSLQNDLNVPRIWHGFLQFIATRNRHFLWAVRGRVTESLGVYPWFVDCWDS